MKKYGIYAVILCSLTFVCKTGAVYGQNTTSSKNHEAFIIDSLTEQNNSLPYYENLYCDQKSIRLSEKQFHLLHSFYLFNAGNQILSFHEIQKPVYQKKFKPLQSYKTLNKNQTYWGKISIHNKIKDTVQWAFYPGWTQYIDVFYRNENNGAFHHARTGYYLPQANNDELYILSNIIPVPIHPGTDSLPSKTEIYIKYKCTDNYTLRIQPIIYRVTNFQKLYNKYIMQRNLI